ncbi:MAG TPA: vanadium-dependent haloperoxidase [Thermoanaerobaculia bacterium]
MKSRTTITLFIFLTAGWAVAVSADMVIDWNRIATQAIVANAGRGPGPALIDLVYANAAMYEAVNAIDGRFQPYIATPPSATPGASEEAAAATAAYKVLTAFFPAQQPFLDGQYAASLATVADGYAKTQGIAIGEEAAAGLLANRAGDGRNDPSIVFPSSDAVGVWRPTPPAFAPYAGPWIGFMRPFVLVSPSQFRAEAPPALDSEQWAADYNETKAFGALNGSARTPEQTEIGLFYSEHTAAQYNRIMRDFAASQNLSLADTARLFALVYLSTGDALISVFDSKFHYGRWRPVTAIRLGDTDGNPATDPDPAWVPLAPTPAHPEYPAAHGAFTGALAEALRQFFGTKNVTITLTSAVTNTSHTFNNTDDLVSEIILGRIFGGMHFRTSVERGLVMGRQAAHFVATHALRPVHRNSERDDRDR